jgi:hypothetical protein
MAMGNYVSKGLYLSAQERAAKLQAQLDEMVEAASCVACAEIEPSDGLLCHDCAGEAADSTLRKRLDYMRTLLAESLPYLPLCTRTQEDVAELLGAEYDKDTDTWSVP